MSARFARNLLVALCAASAVTLAQQQPATQLGSSLGLFIYPAKEQPAAQQQKDDYECFNWSKSQTGFDPMKPAPTVAAAAPPPPTSQPNGTVARSALRGAARGAVIGEIAGGDAGKGAGVGAAVGTFRGADAKRSQAAAQSQQAAAANQQAQADAQAAHQSQVDGFKRGYSTCMGARGYSIN